MSWNQEFTTMYLVCFSSHFLIWSLIFFISNQSKNKVHEMSRAWWPSFLKLWCCSNMHLRLDNKLVTWIKVKIYFKRQKYKMCHERKYQIRKSALLLFFFFFCSNYYSLTPLDDKTPSKKEKKCTFQYRKMTKIKKVKFKI